MSESRGIGAEIMSVSIVAGPEAEAFLGKLQFTSGRSAALLTSDASPLRPSELTIIEQPPEPSPDQIVERIKSIAKKHDMDDLIIQCEPERPVMAYASLFAADNLGKSALADVAQLTTTTFVIKAAAFLDAILNRASSSISACFMAEQIEFVDRIMFDDGSPDFDLAQSIALALNPDAQVSRLDEAVAEGRPELPVRSFDFNASLQRAGWRKLLDGEQESVMEKGRITALGYSAWRPFHPERFWNFLQQKGHAVFRAKGFFWLASRMNEVGGLNLAGADLHCSSAGNWWATRDAQSREIEMPEHTRQQWKEPFGDRRQTFGIMALDLDRQTLQSALDACLLNDAEMSQGPEGWRDFPDPFPSWSHPHPHTHSHEHEDENEGECHHHHHDSDEHHCCHH